MADPLSAVASWSNSVSPWKTPIRRVGTDRESLVASSGVKLVWHNVLFPNVTLSVLADELIFFRTEPHPDDPVKCTFDLWCMTYPVEGIDEVETMAGPKPVKEAAECEHRSFDGGRGLADMAGQIVFQDMSLAEGQQRGLRSQGFDDAYLAGQESRVRRWHEVLNDYLEGRR